MDLLTLALSIGTLVLLVTAYQSWRLGNEERDVALLGIFAGLCGSGAAMSAVA